MSYRYVAQQLTLLNSKLDRIVKELERQGSVVQSIYHMHLGEPNITLDFSLLELPKPEQRTMLALMKIGRGQAADVARITRRARAVESHNLVRLEEVCHLVVSEQVGRCKFYSPQAKK